ncbi:Cytochrome c oxidase subunit 4 [Cystobasidiomycetes sp. EMM_F5]
MLSLARRSLFARQTLAALPKRSISVSAFRKAGGIPVVIGEGAKTGTVPTDFEQATGLERMELLAKMKGEDPFHMEPLDVPHMGTLKNPIKVFSLDTWRIVGCTGFPIDSHDTLYGKVTTDKGHRCPECGCCYAIDFQGDPHAAHH